MEERSEAFRRLAKSRVSKALDDLRLIGNLSNRSSYEYTQAEVDKIFEALEEGIADCKKRFSVSMKRDFTWDD